MDFGTVKTDEKLGRYLEATREIKQGEVFLTEDCLVSGPSGDPHPFPICLACFKVITWEPNYCNACKWPTCSESCEKNPVHSKFECRVFKNAEVKPFKDPMYYFNITVLRCLMLKEANAKKYDSLMKLYPGGKKKIVAPANVADFIFKKCNKKEYDHDTVGKIASIVGMYSFTTTDRLSFSAVPRYASLLFPTAAMMSHDCVPNTSWTRIETEPNLFSIKVWATVDIKAGDKITTQYFDITRPHAERRFYLNETYNFICACKRCVDPTELGTYYGAVKCPCGKGYMLSTDTSKGSDAIWKCEKCSMEMPYRDGTVPVETAIFEEIEKCNDEEEFEKVMDDHAGVTLHPNHWLMMDCRQEIVKRMYSFVATVKPVDELIAKAKKMLQHCQTLSVIIENFYPGHNRIRARHHLYIKYAETLMKGSGRDVDDEIDRIEEVIRKGDEMSIFQ